jgi:hypothetical protein
MSTVSVVGLDRKGLNRVLFRQPGPEHCSGAVYLHSGWFTGNSLHTDKPINNFKVLLKRQLDQSYMLVSL